MLAIGFRAAVVLSEKVEPTIEGPCRAANDHSGESVGFSGGHFATGKDTSEDTTYVEIGLEITQVLDLTCVVQCTDDHPRDLGAHTHPDEPVEHHTGRLVVPDTPGITSIVLNNVAANPPNSLVPSRITMQAVACELTFPCQTGHGGNLFPEIDGVAKLCLGQSLCVLSCLICTDLVVKDGAQHELVRRFLVAPSPV
ncbi:MAG: hypothetical protein OXN97_10405 [Bryobacterales bacterium]|nr:hypothetical protein [Bryobacterales bacterium]